MAASTCSRCQGFVMTDQYETRCLNCGNRPYELLREPEPDRRGRRLACSNCRQPVVEGHNYCQEHLDYFKAYHRTRKQRAGASPCAGEGLPCTD